jgi:decaprenylphospho-beta-D-erythro-pentofuranosid-2-ulose 2-reductase
MNFPPKKILILGATSAIAQAISRKFATADSHFFLAARDAEKLAAVATDLRERTSCKTNEWTGNLADTSLHAELLQQAAETLGQFDLAMVAYGVLPEQATVQNDTDAVLASLNTNFNSTASLLTRLAPVFEKQRCGTLAVITSVAADRGRKTLYVYGAAKAGLGAFTDGLRGRLLPHGVQVLNIKPGIIDTPMTAGIKKGLLASTPEKVAADVHTAIRKGRDILYTPGRWWLVMFIIRHIPERIFKKLSI